MSSKNRKRLSVPHVCKKCYVLEQFGGTCVISKMADTQRELFSSMHVRHNRITLTTYQLLPKYSGHGPFRHLQIKHILFIMISS